MEDTSSPATNQPTNSTNRKSTATFGSAQKGTKKGISSKKGSQKSKDTSMVAE